ncbi:MAG TPA: aminotransferase class I/II-fold pyridoxal phosphate-dependent enzyme [Bacteroidales bacterium]|nr:aminotransferase class I/II-fold pyridoxal phosphate-dependent enzyme [Bacteroidales bacterium]
MSYSKSFSFEAGFVARMSELARQTKAIDLAGNYLSDELVNPGLKKMPEWSPDLYQRVVSPYGLIELRQAISKHLQLHYDRVYNPQTELSISNGPNQNLFAVLTAFLKEGDEVLLFEPAADNYLALILLTGASPVYVSLKENDYHIDWEEVTRLVTSNTRMIIINTPHNPSGMVLSELDMLRLQKVISGTGILVVSDESMANLVYDEKEHQSVAFYPKLAEQSILISSLAQQCRVPWPVAFCAAPEPLMKAIRGVFNVVDGGHFAPLQMLLAEGLEPAVSRKELIRYYQNKRDRFNESLLTNTRFEPLPSSGSVFQLISYAKISDERDFEFAERLLHDYGVATVPFGVFTHEKQKRCLLRLNFGRPDDLLDEAVTRLARL